MAISRRRRRCLRDIAKALLFVVATQVGLWLLGLAHEDAPFWTGIAMVCVAPIALPLWLARETRRSAARRTA